MSKEESVILKRQLLDKHQQLMKMHMRDGNLKFAEEQFEIVTDLFLSLHNDGESMSYYTTSDHEKNFSFFKYNNKKVDE